MYGFKYRLSGMNCDDAPLPAHRNMQIKRKLRKNGESAAEAHPPKTSKVEAFTCPKTILFCEGIKANHQQSSNFTLARRGLALLRYSYHQRSDTEYRWSHKPRIVWHMRLFHIQKQNGNHKSGINPTSLIILPPISEYSFGELRHHPQQQLLERGNYRQHPSSAVGRAAAAADFANDPSSSWVTSITIMPSFETGIDGRGSVGPTGGVHVAGKTSTPPSRFAPPQQNGRLL